MSEEYLDIIDENACPTGETAPRSVVHATGLRHRTSHLWLMRFREGVPEILLQKRSQEKDSFPGCYDISSAGHIPAGVEPVPSAIRELREELGLTAQPEELVQIGQRRFFYRNVFHGKLFLDNQISNVYLLLRDVAPEDMTLQETEIESVRWMTLADCRHMVEAHTLPNCIDPEEVGMLERAAYLAAQGKL